MRTYHNAAQFNLTEANVFDSLSEDLSAESSYGLEYIIDEIFKDKKLRRDFDDQPVDWFGLYDLSI